MIVIICAKYKKNPSRIVDATERTRFSKSRPNDLEDIGQGHRSLCATHPLVVVIICGQYGKNPSRTVDVTERTRQAGQTDGRTDGRTEWNQYTPQQLRCQDASDLRCHHAHYDVTEMECLVPVPWYILHQLINPMKSLCTSEFNSLCLSDAIWHHGTLSILVQVMACCFFGVKPLFDPTIINWALSYKLQPILNQKTNIFTHVNALVNSTSEIKTIWFRHQCIKMVFKLLLAPSFIVCTVSAILEMGEISLWYGNLFPGVHMQNWVQLPTVYDLTYWGWTKWPAFGTQHFQIYILRKF